MKASVRCQLGVLVGLLIAAVCCLFVGSQDFYPDNGSAQLYERAISSLEAQAPFESKERVIAVLKTSLAAEIALHRALEDADAVIHAFGICLLALSFLQAAGLNAALRANGNAT